jgi:hypothetical protein
LFTGTAVVLVTLVSWVSDYERADELYIYK